ncbi:MAG: hypothetical protein H0T89_00040 [Deltaproteobacteria bacterium]|nr:hypothetical protein [Deltaproteobacteria bacterium]MDQ3295302.1 hypothetical protein [Myxococcota bacterium]
MPRSPGQSDFVVTRPVEEPELDADGQPTTAASARATRWVMTLTFVMLAMLGLICAIGPHIPPGD